MVRTHGAATCTDCGRVYLNRPDETGALCEECCQDRDEHTTALQLRMATVRVAIHAAREVA